MVVVLLGTPGFLAALEAPAVTRDWRLWPFVATSPWNMAIGSGAVFAPVPEVNALPVSINYQGQWGVGIELAAAADPLHQLYFNNANWAFIHRTGKNAGLSPAQEAEVLKTASKSILFEGNAYSTTNAADDSKGDLPASFHHASEDFHAQFHSAGKVKPSPDTDGHLAIFQPDGWVLESLSAIRLANGDVVAGCNASYTDAKKGDGTGWWNGRRASSFPDYAGIIRKGEIASGRIPHAMVADLPAKLLTREAVWPATTFDRNSGYGGKLPMGSLLAIPPDVDVTKLQLSPPALVVAHAAQDYGIYVGDRGGDGLTIVAEIGAPDTSWPGDWHDLQVIASHLQRVTNNDAKHIGGGGTPRVALAPPFAD